MTRRRSPAGFTLIETLAALTVTGLVLLGAILLLDQLTDSGGRIARDGARIAREGNGERVLRHLLIDARVTTDTLHRFRGDEGSADFSTLCQESHGWLELCRASVAIDHRGDSSVVLAMLSTGEHLELTRYAGRAELRYFDALPVDSAWTRRWAPSIAMPAAIGIAVGGDTLVYPLGSVRD